jgi:hypothetical protein
MEDAEEKPTTTTMKKIHADEEDFPEVPEQTFMPNWPEYLTDTQGDTYVLLRDGKPSGDYGGEACLYGRIGSDGYIDRAHQWTPVLGATYADMRLAGGTWMSAKQLIAAGQTPITMPDEPINIP